MKKILLMSFMLLFTIVSSSWAQDRTVSGKVTDDTGESIPGVNVILKGTTTGTTTDIDGNYKLSVPADGGTLVFSFIGMATQEVEIGARSVIDLGMAADATELSEVVVTAVGIAREKKALGYGVENVAGDEVQQRSEADLLRTLQGKVAGVNIGGSSSAPGSSTRITIRGNSSLLGNNQPLFVVDGIPVANQSIRASDPNGLNNNNDQLTGGGATGSLISSLDQNNIESITVLKGAAAAALYGSRAANGVIVITTKTGNSKVGKGGLEVGFSTSYSIEKVANLPDYQNTYGTGTNFAFSQVNGSWGAPFVGTRNYATTTEIPHWYDGVVGFEDLWGTTVPYQAYPDNVENFFETGKLRENSISIRGGNETSTLSVVLSNTKHDGIVPESSFERTSISVGGNSELANGLIIGANLQYTKTNQHSFQGGANNAIGNGSAFARTLYLGRNWDLHGQPFQNPLNNSSQFFVGAAQADNPLWSVRHAGVDALVNRIFANVSIGYDITDWLNVSYKIGVNQFNQESTDYFRPGSRGAGGSGQVTQLFSTFEEVESNFIVTVSKDITEDIGFVGLVGHNLNQRTSDAQGIQGTGFIDFNIIDPDNTTAQIAFGGQFNRRRLFGAYADLSFDYKDWLFLGLTGRNDWTSTLPSSNRSFFYSSVNTAFVLTDALDISSNVLSFAKVRASWAKVGAATQAYQITPIFLLNGNGLTAAGSTAMPFNGTAGATLSNIARDPNLKPENTIEKEVGLELRLLNSRINLDVALYDRRTTDQIVGIQIPRESGFSSNFTNIGEVSNKGVEISLGITPIKLNNGFQWDIFGTFTHNKNEIVSLVDGVDELVLLNTFAGSVQSVHQVGQEYGLLKGSTSARDDEGNLLIDPSNGQLISALAPEIIGNPNPDFIVGLTNTFSWKGISLSAVIDWRQGGDMYSVTNLSLLGRGVTTDTEDREINVVIPGVYGDPNTGEPLRNEAGEKTANTTMVEINTLYFGNTFGINGQDEWNVWDATVIRLREVALSYQFPASLLEKTPFGSARLSITGRNLWYNAPNFPPGSNFDPEVSTFGASNAQGLEFTSSPSVRRFGFNLNVTF